MPRMLRMPTEEELPPGPHRRFLEELHQYYREAGRPDIPQIVARIERQKEDEESSISLTLSRETVRRILKGKTLSSWRRVEVLFDVLCIISRRDTEADRWSDSNEPYQSHRSFLRELWGAAADQVEIKLVGPLPDQSRHRAQAESASQQRQAGSWPTAQPQSGGWGASGAGYSDEPPF